jgi:type I restriction enzyme R subunit
MKEILYNESALELSVVDIFQSLGYERLKGEEIERSSGDVVLRDRFEDALRRINPKIHPDAITEAKRKFFAVSSQNIAVEKLYKRRRWKIRLW